LAPAHNLSLRLDVPGGNRVNGQDLWVEHKIAIKLAINTIREQYPVASDMLDHYLDCSGEDYTISGTLHMKI